MQNAVDTIFTAFARAEELFHPEAILLHNFPRSIQLDGHTCGSKSVYTVLRYFRKRCTVASIERSLRTTWEGTDYSDIKRVIRERGLKGHEVKSFRELIEAIDCGFPVIVSMYHNFHWSVLYGYSRNMVFVANPSLGSMGSISVAIPKERFLLQYDGFGLAISDKTG